MKYNILYTYLKFSFVFFILNCLAFQMAAQTNSVLLDNKSYETAIYQNKKNGLPEFSGLYSNYVFTIDKIELSDSDSIKIYHYLSEIPCVVSCKLEFNRQIIEIKCSKEKSNDNLKKILDKLKFMNIQPSDYIEQLYKN